VKVLLINDQTICCSHTIYQIVLQQNGHDAILIDAREVWNDDSCTGYSPDTTEQILSAARALRPDWVYMVLQGCDTGGQVFAAIAIHNELPETKLIFTSGHDHDKELQVARDRGLKLEFRPLPLAPKELLDIVAKPTLAAAPEASWFRRILSKASLFV
jgi:hypothetical protein